MRTTSVFAFFFPLFSAFSAVGQQYLLVNKQTVSTIKVKQSQKKKRKNLNFFCKQTGIFVGFTLRWLMYHNRISQLRNYESWRWLILQFSFFSCLYWSSNDYDCWAERIGWYQDNIGYQNLSEFCTTAMSSWNTEKN